MKEIALVNACVVEEAPDWEVLDSGASLNVIGRAMANAVAASVPRLRVQDEVSDGSYIEHLGRNPSSRTPMPDMSTISERRSWR